MEVSQEALANAVGITFQQVQKYEKGMNRISASRLVQFAQFLDVEPSYFFEDAPDVRGKGDVTPEAAFRSTPECARLMKVMGSITDPNLRKAAVEGAEIFAKELMRAAGDSGEPKAFKE
jgi:transcriptional regulator with XRE-family HTH domain